MFLVESPFVCKIYNRSFQFYWIKFKSDVCWTPLKYLLFVAFQFQCAPRLLVYIHVCSCCSHKWRVDLNISILLVKSLNKFIDVNTEEKKQKTVILEEMSIGYFCIFMFIFIHLCTFLRTISKKILNNASRIETRGKKQ